MRADGLLTTPGVAGSQVPQLEVDGKILQQSQAISTFCAKLAGLYPEDAWAAAKVDEATQFIIQDIRGRLIEPSMRAPDETKVKLRAELNDEKLPEKFAILEKMLDGSGYLCGGALSVADLHLYVLLNWIGMGTLDGIKPEDVILKCPNLTAFVKKINEMEKVKAWNAEKNPKLPWC